MEEKSNEQIINMVVFYTKNMDIYKCRFLVAILGR